jgi:hypothetical protein
VAPDFPEEEETDDELIEEEEDDDDDDDSPDYVPSIEEMKEADLFEEDVTSEETPSPHAESKYIVSCLCVL